MKSVIMFVVVTAMSIRNRLLFLTIISSLVCANLSSVVNKNGSSLYTLYDLKSKFSPKNTQLGDLKGIEGVRKALARKEDLLPLHGLGTERKQNYSDSVRLDPDVNPKKKFENNEQKVSYGVPDDQCNFEDDCSWKWKTDDGNGFFVSNGESDIKGLDVDSDNKSTGHFLLFRLKPNSTTLQVTSPFFNQASENCKIQLWIFQKDMIYGKIEIVAETVNHTQYTILSGIRGDNQQEWIRYDRRIGRKSRSFRIILEVVPSKRSLTKSAVVAFDNLKLLDCFPESDRINSCTSSQYRCFKTNVCINATKICDIDQDCKFGDDELQNCDKIPYGARCNFEQDWCGWYNTHGNVLEWIRHNGAMTREKTGSSYDHTYGNVTGKYLFVNMTRYSSDVNFGSSAILNSIIFNPPPSVHGNSSSKYYKSCTIRFYLHQYGIDKSGMKLQVTEMRPNKNVTSEILWSYNNFGDKWMGKTVFLPNITHKYYLHFRASEGFRYMGDVAIDDFSMSPECFGLNIPQSELNNYNYSHPDVEYPSSALPRNDFINETFYEFTTCGVTGRDGPVQDNCTKAYKNTSVIVEVMHGTGLKGFQNWMAPTEGYYTFILLGASGGTGSSGTGSSRGAMVRTVMKLQKWQEILILVGQEGTSACVKSLKNHNTKYLTERHEVTDGGGGGGGGSFVFMRNGTRHLIPLAIAAGGGGLGSGRFINTGSQHGQDVNLPRSPIASERSASEGGGWTELQGALGGKACYDSIEKRGDGGFGGGGGGCTAGGGGGGYVGGNAWSTNTSNGRGGYSFLDSSRTIPTFSVVQSGYHTGPGSVIIVPAASGCGCSYKCIALDVKRSQVACICPKGEKLDVDGKICIFAEHADAYPNWVVILVSFVFLSVVITFGFVCFKLYTRYQHRFGKTIKTIRTQYNPVYENAGTRWSIKDLNSIPRKQLVQEKVLGVGEFGVVYQGVYSRTSGNAVEMMVAIKTLSAKLNQDVEVDFYMEALIMSQFNHPNIVHFIGVCFEKNPQFIVLELLGGGDLKSFLRESRPKPGESSVLGMRDLVMIAIDVAKGCLYMENHHFIHRDIAARNCLLTMKGPGRLVKIADFGMSRDIYRSDYYRKDGKAMLPIKWMPPEAFLDGIFTSKTDVWSFGVLLWEITSMGYMPYTECGNKQVIEFVVNGGRLEPPKNCPDPIYAIMTQCWYADPEERPTFSLILERLGYCLQDPEVINSPLPIFTQPLSQEKDQTIMRPENDQCIKIDKLLTKAGKTKKLSTHRLANLENHVLKPNSPKAENSLNAGALMEQSLSHKMNS